MSTEFVRWEQEREIIRHLEEWLKDKPDIKSLATLPYREHIKHHKYNAWKQWVKEYYSLKKDRHVNIY